MHFLSWGDFTLPFQWSLYFSKHFYMWSYQSGTSNPDGLIRLPGRILNFLFFGLFGNVGASYFYLSFSLAVAFAAFFFFARSFLKIKSVPVQVIGALFFAFNPIFLGNLAKVGLVLAAAMLPLCLLAIRATFQQQKFRFLLLYIVCLNISFLHPFTFSVNFVVSVSYLAYLAWCNKDFVRKNLHKFALIGVLGLMLNLYFILPTISMGTVSKDVISTNISPTPTDYTALVGVSNTGNLFTGLSLSKNVFVDFAFYNDTYQNVYFFGVFGFYVIMFGLYLYTERRLKLTDRRRLGVLFACFLVLMALAAVTIAHLDVIIKMLIGLPGGWAFRSPLKWQLYIPLALFSILAVLLNRVPHGRRLLWAQLGLATTFLIMNGYIAVDIYHKLLVPREPTHFAGLMAADLTNKTVLLVNNGDCMTYMRNNPSVTVELNQIIGSKNAQVKHVIEDQADTVNLGSYDYIIGCHDHLQHMLESQYRFKTQQTYVHGIFRLYANRAPLTPIYVTDHVFRADTQQPISGQYDFANKQLGQFFTTIKTNDLPATTMSDIFKDVTPASIQNDKVTGTLAPAKASELYIRPGDKPVYYSSTTSAIAVSADPGPGLQPLPSHASAPIEVPAGAHQTLAYSDRNFDYKNLVADPSLEKGLWQKQVSDCYNYDNQPAISMRLDTASKTDGQQSLELIAKNHIACTGPYSIAVQPGEHYLVSFDYQGVAGQKSAGYRVDFDDSLGTAVQERLDSDSNSWQTFGTEITVPTGAHHLKLQLYAYPDSYGRYTAVTHYDQVGVRRSPGLQNRFYLVSQASSRLQVPRNVQYQLHSPTRKAVQITGATRPFYLGMNETYDKLWQLELQTAHGAVQWPFAHRTVISGDRHVHLNDTTNGWYVDPASICSNNPACTKEPDGSYDFAMVVEFVPQRWFYLGGTISALAVVMSAAYYLYDRRHGEGRKEGVWRWRK